MFQIEEYICLYVYVIYVCMSVCMCTRVCVCVSIYLFFWGCAYINIIETAGRCWHK